jgi:Polyketide cyclase / dehydrase and lipid transport
MFWDIFKFSVVESVIIDATAEEVWKIVTDLGNTHNYLSRVAYEELLDGTPIRVGARVRRGLVVQDKVVPSTATISIYDDADDGNFPKCIAVFSDNILPQLSQLKKWTVERVTDDSSPGCCRLVVSSTMLPRSLCICMNGTLILCTCRVRGPVSVYVRKELQEYKAAAESMAAGRAEDEQKQQ